MDTSIKGRAGKGGRGDEGNRMKSEGSEMRRKVCVVELSRVAVESGQGEGRET